MGKRRNLGIKNFKIFGLRFPAIALSVSDKEKNQSINNSNPDILEIRIDKFKKLGVEYIKENILLRKKLKLPIILTVRSKEEGGEKKIPEEIKLDIFKNVCSLGDFIDIELKSPIISKVIEIAKNNRKLIIVSYHNLDFTPNIKILKDILFKAKDKGADIVKIATKANNFEDVNRLMEFTKKYRTKKIITISLGKTGSVSRLVFPMFGSLVTYTYISKPTACGQLPIKILKQHLKIYYPK